MQTSCFGLRIERLEPYVGIDWIAISVDEDDFRVSGSIFIPHLGTKYHLNRFFEEGKISPYILGDIYFSLASVNGNTLSREEEEALSDLLGFWGIGIGFGSEYFFSKFFSVGGEYGLRMIFNNIEEHSSVVEDRYGGINVEKVNDNIDAAFRISYAAVRLNFRFDLK
jgi:hypothetical protein